MNAFQQIGRKSSVTEALQKDSWARVGNMVREKRSFERHGSVRRRSSASMASLNLNNTPNGEYRK